MEVLVAYDVSTETAQGRARLRRVAKICEGYGQRVQKSVFECILNAGQLEMLKHRLARVVKVDEDSLRIYRLQEPREQYLQVIGKPQKHDLRDPLIL